MRRMNQIDRRISCAPMMDWTDARNSARCLNSLRVLEKHRSLYVASVFDYSDFPFHFARRARDRRRLQLLRLNGDSGLGAMVGANEPCVSAIGSRERYFFPFSAQRAEPSRELALPFATNRRAGLIALPTHAVCLRR